MISRLYMVRHSIALGDIQVYLIENRKMRGDYIYIFVNVSNTNG